MLGDGLISDSLALTAIALQTLRTVIAIAIPSKAICDRINTLRKSILITL